MSKNKINHPNRTEISLIEIKSKVSYLVHWKSQIKHKPVIDNKCIRYFLIFINFSLQFEAEFRRWSIKRSENLTQSFDDFHSTIENLHKLQGFQFLISYIDPRDNDLLPINNDDNYNRALTHARPLLRLIIQRKGM